MPYKSDAQRRFFHTDTAKKAGITDKDVNEFDKASKGMKLPEKAPKMAYGGETNPKHETVKSMENNPTAGFADGGEVQESPVITWLREKLMAKGAPIASDQIENATAQGVDTSSGTAHMSEGGELNVPDGGKDYGTLVGLRELLKKAQNGEDVHEHPEPIDTGDGKFMGEYEVGVSTHPQHMADGGQVQPFGVPPNTPYPDGNTPPTGQMMDSFGNPIIPLPPATNQDTGQFDPIPALMQKLASIGKGPAQPDASDQAATMIRQAGTPPINPQGMAPVMPTMAGPTPNIPMNFGDNTPSPAPAPQAQPQPEQAPDISQVMQKINQTPSTDYNFYKNMTAEDRAALLAKLTQQQHSGANLLASGAAGLGDAIARSFGHQNTNYQQNVQEGAQKAKEEAVGSMDTERAQKLQDVQAKQMAELDDPNSPTSKAMRATFKSAGINVPSGLPGSLMMKIAPDLGNFALKQATLGVLSGKNTMEARSQLEGRLNDLLKQKSDHYIQGVVGTDADKALDNEITTIKAQLANMGVQQPSNALPTKVGMSSPHPSGAIITRTK